MKKTVPNPGKNIALKVPPDEFEKSVAFYRDVIGLTVLKTTAQGSVAFEFGGKKLWVDRRPALSQAEIWLELSATGTAAAAKHLAKHGVVRRDETEPLPAEMKAKVRRPKANVTRSWTSVLPSMSGCGRTVTLLVGKRFKALGPFVTLRWQNGKVSVTDGPYAETKEQLGGFGVVEAKDSNHAIQLMSHHPVLKQGIVEIRPAEDLTSMIHESERRRTAANTERRPLTCVSTEATYFPPSTAVMPSSPNMAHGIGGCRIMRINFDHNGKAVGKEVFAEGWLQGTFAWGRPTDILKLPDGSLLISDDYKGAIYRITYGPPIPAPPAMGSMVAATFPLAEPRRSACRLHGATAQGFSVGGAAEPFDGHQKTWCSSEPHDRRHCDPLAVLMLAHNLFGDRFLEARCSLGGKTTGQFL